MYKNRPGVGVSLWLIADRSLPLLKVSGFSRQAISGKEDDAGAQEHPHADPELACHPPRIQVMNEGPLLVEALVVKVKIYTYIYNLWILTLLGVLLGDFYSILILFSLGLWEQVYPTYVCHSSALGVSRQPSTDALQFSGHRAPLSSLPTTTHACPVLPWPDLYNSTRSLWSKFISLAVPLAFACLHRSLARMVWHCHTLS